MQNQACEMASVFYMPGFAYYVARKCVSACQSLRWGVKITAAGCPLEPCLSAP